jgi:peptidoglycan/LPS O-acetylase OafA/YrhL
MQTVKLDFRTDINALRAFAVISVIGYHFSVPGFAGGFAGVDVFFVISGYLITSQIQQNLASKRFSFLDFYISRIRRIFPALAAMCFCVLLFGWFYTLPAQYVADAKTAFDAAYFNSNTGFILKDKSAGYFDSVNKTISPLLHTWSLSIEGQFYLFFPLFWVFAGKKLSKYLLHVVMGALVLALGYFAFDVQHHTNASFYSLTVRAWEFLAGAVLLIMPTKSVKTAAANFLQIIGLITLLCCTYFLSSEFLWPSFWTLIPVIATAMVISAKNSSLSDWLLDNWFIQRTGDMSYSLYLWHWPLIVFIKQFASDFGREMHSTELMLTLLITYGCAYLSWRFIERPIRLNKRIWTARRLTVFFVIVLITFWSVWRGLSLTNGLPARFDGLTTSKSALLPTPLPVYFQTCFSQVNVISSADDLKFCEINAKSNQSKSVLFWGDSHAQQYQPALEYAMIDLNLNGQIATRKGCRPTLPNQFPYGTFEPEEQSCIEFNNKVNRLIDASPEIKTVVLGRQWMHGESVGQTLDLVKSLTASGKHVVLLDVIPNPDYLVPDVWARREIWTRKRILNISEPRDKNTLPDISKYVQEKIIEADLQNKVTVIHPMDYFCNATDCFHVKDGVENFIDKNHITPAKALEFVDEFKRALKK